MLKISTKFVFLFVCMFSFFNYSIQYSNAQVNPNAEVEAKVRASFPDMPKMIEIAKCESGFRQFGPDGSPLRGGAGRNYIGIFQIGEGTHAKTAASMAYDIYTVEGNIAYARYMYFQRGTAPWISCINDSSVTGAPVPVVNQTPSPSPTPSPTPNTPTTTPAPTPTSNPTGSLTVNLSYRMVHPEVLTLQQILNKNGFTVASSGPGSVGNETAMFGQLTRDAVRKFQCAKGIACDGTEATTGFGRVGPMTRAALNKLTQ